MTLRERARPRRREALDVVDIAANGTILAASAVHKTYKSACRVPMCIGFDFVFGIYILVRFL